MPSYISLMFALLLPAAHESWHAGFQGSVRRGFWLAPHLHLLFSFTKQAYSCSGSKAIRRKYQRYVRKGSNCNGQRPKSHLYFTGSSSLHLWHYGRMGLFNKSKTEICRSSAANLCSNCSIVQPFLN